MTPEELQELCALYVLGTLPPPEAATIEARLQAGDPQVVREVQAFREMVGLLPHALPPVMPPAAVRARLMARVASSESASESRHIPTVRGGWLAWFGRPLIWFPATAVILLVAILGGLVFDLRQQVRGLQAEVQQLRQAARERERLLVLLTVPEVKIVTLTATEHAPGAGARVLWDTQHSEWTVFSHDLPTLPPAKTYQLWFLTPGGAVPSGTFYPDLRQRGIIQVALPAGRTDIAGAAVSIEPVGGVKQPTGNIVLVGKF
jgi:anti-sigma-K factor RskA